VCSAPGKIPRSRKIGETWGTRETCGIRAVPFETSDSLGNPFVHSLLVTLGNHAIRTVQPYNWPCPNGHLRDWRLALGALPGKTSQEL
jgi:hypothetical protein